MRFHCEIIAMQESGTLSPLDNRMSSVFSATFHWSGGILQQLTLKLKRGHKIRVFGQQGIGKA